MNRELFDYKTRKEYTVNDKLHNPSGKTVADVFPGLLQYSKNRVIPEQLPEKPQSAPVAEEQPQKKRGRPRKDAVAKQSTGVDISKSKVL